MPKTPVLASVLVLLLVPPACDKAEPSEQTQVLQGAIQELRAAREVFEADGAATREELDKVRHELQAANAKLAAIVTQLEETARRRGSELPRELEGSRALPPEAEVSPADVAAAIHCESELRCTIHRSFLERLSLDSPMLLRQARIVPAMRDGKSEGFKLYGIRPSSVPKALGLENGDLVGSINGKPLLSVEDALALYTTLRTETSLVFGIQRNGVPSTLTVDIVDGPETSGSSAP